MTTLQGDDTVLTKQQAAIVDHLKRTDQNGYIHPETPAAKELAPKMLPLRKADIGLYGGIPDELSAYYEALNERKAQS